MSGRSGSGRSWLASPPPPVAVEITATRVLALSLSDAGAGHAVGGYGLETLPAGVISPALNAVNLHDPAALTAAITAALAPLGGRIRRVALVLPDSVAKVSLIRFEKVPARVQDLEQLIRWQVRKAAPFRIEEAQVAWQPALPLPGGGQEYLVTVARKDIVQAYENAAEAAGVHAGIVDIASFNQVNAVLAGAPGGGDWLLVNVAADYATLAIVRQDHVIFFRNRTGGIGDLPDLVHQTAMYHEDRLGGGGFVRVVLAGTSVLGLEEGERFRRVLDDRLGMRVDPIDFRPTVELRDRIAPSPELLDTMAAGVGVLLRERAASSRRAAVSGEQVA